MISSVYDRRILKIIKILRRVLKFKRLRMVFYGSAYKRRAISCFLTAGMTAAIGGFSHGNFLPSATFPWAFVAGLTSHSAKQGKNPNSKPSNKSQKSTDSGSEKPKKRKKSKAKTTIDLMKRLFPEIHKIIETGLQGSAVVIYVRVSSWVQVFDGKSLDYQEEELIKTAIKIGASLIYVIRDEGKSGRDFTNRNLGTILQLAARGKFQRLLVSEVDRAGRDAFELLSFVFQLRRYDVLVQTPSEILDVKRLVDLVKLAFKSVGAEVGPRLILPAKICAGYS